MDIPGPEFGYTDLLDYEIQNSLKKEDKERQEGIVRWNPLRPSSAGFCARRLAYDTAEYRGKGTYPKDIIDPRLHRLFDLGHSVEFSALRIFDRQIKGLTQKYRQQSLSFFKIKRGNAEPEELLEGKPDSVFFLDLPDGEGGEVTHKSIMDVKSAGDGWTQGYKGRWERTLEKFQNMETLVTISDTGKAFFSPDIVATIDELGDDFIVDNIIQLNLYGRADFILERGVDHCWLYKYNKNNSDHYEFRWVPDQRLVDLVEEKFNDVSIKVDQERVEEVEKDYVLGSMHCSLCPRKKQCWGDEDAKRAFYKTLPPKRWPRDTNRLERGGEIEALFDKYLTHAPSVDKMKRVEDDIVKLMVEMKEKKIRLAAGGIWEVRFLKSVGKDGAHVLRKGKL